MLRRWHVKGWSTDSREVEMGETLEITMNSVIVESDFSQVGGGNKPWAAEIFRCTSVICVRIYPGRGKGKEGMVERFDR